MRRPEASCRRPVKTRGLPGHVQPPRFAPFSTVITAPHCTFVYTRRTRLANSAAIIVRYLCGVIIEGVDCHRKLYIYLQYALLIGNPNYAGVYLNFNHSIEINQSNNFYPLVKNIIHSIYKKKQQFFPNRFRIFLYV